MLRSYIRNREERCALEGGTRATAAMQVGGELLHLDASEHDSISAMRACSAENLRTSDAYFAISPNSNYSVVDNVLVFPSPVPTEYPENNFARAQLYECDRRDRAVLIIPHWNSHPDSYAALCRLLRRSGMTAACMTLPYHGVRSALPPGEESPMISANLGRTIRSCRQAVLEARLALSWLEAQGYSSISLIGSSLGTALASVVAAHDHRVDSLTLLSAASDFGEVIWTGRATRHIRESFGGRLQLHDVKEIFSPFSPIHYVDRLAALEIPVFGISGSEDTVFLPRLTHALRNAYRKADVRHDWKTLPCGHYTLGTFPFNLWVTSLVLRNLLSAGETIGSRTTAKVPEFHPHGRPAGGRRLAA